MIRAIAVLAFLASTASADVGPALSLRGGFMWHLAPGLPSGGDPVVPSGGVDFGFRFADAFEAGVYADTDWYPNGAGGCPAGAGCSAHALRGGLQVLAHLAPRSFVDPWIGVGSGVDYVWSSMTVGGHEATGDSTGWELARLQFGLEMPYSRTFAIGPYAMLAFTHHTSTTSTVARWGVKGSWHW